jgi:hypothetical protein
LTPLLGAHSMSPESSDGLASVGTILPKEKAALLPGGFLVSTISGIFGSGTGLAWLGLGVADSFTPTESAVTISTGDADVAQLVEQLIRNQQVVRSIRIVGSNIPFPRINLDPSAKPLSYVCL